MRDHGVFATRREDPAARLFAAFCPGVDVGAPTGPAARSSGAPEPAEYATNVGTTTPVSPSVDPPVSAPGSVELPGSPIVVIPMGVMPMLIGVTLMGVVVDVPGSVGPPESVDGVPGSDPSPVMLMGVTVVVPGSLGPPELESTDDVAGSVVAESSATAVPTPGPTAATIAAATSHAAPRTVTATSSPHLGPPELGAV